MKKIFIWLAVAITVAMGLSYFANIAYAYTILGLAIWAFVGHLITLDDDMPKEWSNPDGSVSFWRNSKIELLIKFLVVLTLLIIILAFPGVRELGA